MSTTFCNGLGMSTSDGFFGFSAIEITYLSSFRTGGLTSQRFQAANQQNIADVLRHFWAGTGGGAGPLHKQCANEVVNKGLFCWLAAWKRCEVKPHYNTATCLLAFVCLVHVDIYL